MPWSRWKTRSPGPSRWNCLEVSLGRRWSSNRFSDWQARRMTWSSSSNYRPLGGARGMELSSAPFIGIYAAWDCPALTWISGLFRPLSCSEWLKQRRRSCESVTCPRWKPDLDVATTRVRLIKLVWPLSVGLCVHLEPKTQWTSYL